MKVVINKCFGGFGLSDLAYKELIKLGVLVKKYTQEERDENGLYKNAPENEGEVIFDRELTPLGEDNLNDIYWNFKGKTKMAQRYWETWLNSNRTHSLLIKVVEKLGKKANSSCADLKIIEIPDGIKFTIEEYDGIEHIAEEHITWE